VDADYPEHLPAREPAPSWDGEGAFGLWHFSEDASLTRFRPRAAAVKNSTVAFSASRLRNSAPHPDQFA
jgi:hypothetical protein